MRRSFGGERRDMGRISIEQAYARATGELEEFRPKEDDPMFVDTYGAARVEEDLKYVQKRERQFGEQKDHFQKHAEVFEAIFFDQIEMAEWLGPDITTTPTSKYDDIANGVDCVAAIQEGMGQIHAGMAFDVTEGRDSIEKKLARVKKEIDEGHLAEVRYFKSDDESFVGTLRNIPRLIVAIDRKIVDDLAEKWMGNNNKELANHYVQRMILDQILAQLEHVHAYAKKIGQTQIARTLANYRVLFERVKKQKEAQDNIVEADIETMLQSEVYQEFMYLIKHFGE